MSPQQPGDTLLHVEGKKCPVLMESTGVRIHKSVSLFLRVIVSINGDLMKDEDHDDQ